MAMDEDCAQFVRRYYKCQVKFMPILYKVVLIKRIIMHI